IIDDFHLAMMLFVTAADISTSQYQALVEVLKLATKESLESLPRSIPTLRDTCRNSFPLATIKSRSVDVSLDVTPPKTQNPRRGYYFDISEYVHLWLSSPHMRPKLHLGMGVIVDNPSEYWHGDAWLESVRTTSGEFARIRDKRDDTEHIILPSDCVRFINNDGSVATGRIQGIGVDENLSKSKSLSNSLLPNRPSFCVRRIVYIRGGTVRTRPVHQSHRVVAEGELIHLTRQYVLENMVSRPSEEGHIRRLSIPFSAFIDGFGLYRNAYHSLKGFYVTPTGLTVEDRCRLVNMFVLMIGLFGCGESEMAKCLAEDSIKTGRGFETTLETEDSERVFVTAFPLLFIGDMPQQNQNSGCKTHNAEFGCRSCFVPDTQRGNLTLDISSTGRYKAQVELIYQQSLQLRTKTAKLVIWKKYGLSPEGPFFSRCFPMMDTQRACPNDPMHAELRFSKYFAEALLEGILSPTGILAYREAWNIVEVPYGWGQPQNPLSHKGSMVFSEHGRMPIMNPFVL
ncbi:hypothetical protein DFP73DRAFT_460823, partial [Morchella snyderi]